LDYISSPALNRFQFASITIKGNEEPAKKKMAEQLSDLLWSDPITPISHTPAKLGCFPNKDRGIGWVFGEDVTANFCKKYGFNAIIRSHECRQQGITKDHASCYTVFSSSYYCSGSNQAAVIILDASETRLQTHTFSTYPTDTESDSNNKDFLITSFKSFLNKDSSEFLRLFEAADQDKNNWLELSVWADIISKYVSQKYECFIEPAHLITLKDYLCPCDEEKQTAKYRVMFNYYEGGNDQESLELLENVFNMIDSDGNGSIAKHEADEALRFMNRTLGKNYSSDFLNKMDLNGDGKISVNEFKIGFCKAFNIGTHL
jgi:predicted RNA-binding Zn-ribbon protein involved in translation (DUF1610 family)